MKILIIGSTGTLGKNIVNQAINAGFEVRCLVRSFTALNLLPVKAEFVYGDLSDPVTIPSALKNISIVIDTATTREYDNYSAEVVDWKGKMALIEASKLAKIEQFIFFSLFGTKRNTNIPLVDLKFEVENLLLKAPFKVTIFQCSGFFQGLITQFAIPILENETIWLTRSSYSTSIAYIDALDVADIVVRLLKVVSLRKNLLLAKYYAYRRMSTNQLIIRILESPNYKMQCLVKFQYSIQNIVTGLSPLIQDYPKSRINYFLQSKANTRFSKSWYCLMLSLDTVGLSPVIQSYPKSRIKYFFQSIHKLIMFRYFVRQSKNLLTKSIQVGVRNWLLNSQFHQRNMEAKKSFDGFGFFYRNYASIDSNILQLGISYRKWIKGRLLRRYVRGIRTGWFLCGVCEYYFLNKKELHCWLFVRPKNTVFSLKGNKEWTANQIITLCERFAAKKAKVFYIPEFILFTLTKVLQAFEGARNISDRLQLLRFDTETFNIKPSNKVIKINNNNNSFSETSVKLIKLELYSLPGVYSKMDLGNTLERVDLELYLQAYFRMIRRKLLEKNYQKLQKR